MAQGFDGVHVGGADGGVEAEDDADEGGDGEGHHGRPEGDNGPHAGKPCHAIGNRDAEENAEQTAGGGRVSVRAKRSPSHFRYG